MILFKVVETLADNDTIPAYWKIRK